jgi:hypothetical protein
MSFLNTDCTSRSEGESNSNMREFINNKLNKPNEITPSNRVSIDNSGDEHSESCSSESSYNTMVIDINILKGEDTQKKHYLILKDKNDPSLKNIISILRNPDDMTVKDDNLHLQQKNCANHKYLCFSLDSIKSKYNTKILAKFPLAEHTPNALQQVTLNINNEAVSKFRKNTLIVESKDHNCIQVNNTAFFASRNEKLLLGKLKVTIPVPEELDSVFVVSQKDVAS